MESTNVDKWVGGASPSEAARAVAARALRSRLDAVRHFLQLAADPPRQDVEYVHELRVWTRRAGTALKLYRDLLPRRQARWLRKQMRRIRRAAGAARDCDVLGKHLERHAADPAIARWLSRVQAERQHAQRPIVALRRRLDRGHRLEGRVDRLLEQLCDRTRRGTDSDLPFGPWARGRLRPLVIAFFRAFPSADADAAGLHRFRIRSKQLRYAMELLAPAFPPDFRRKLSPIVQAFQDDLGHIEDLAVARGRLRKQIKRADGPRQARRLRKLLKAECARLRKARRSFLRRCTKRSRSELRDRFKAAMGEDDRASTVLALPQAPAREPGPGLTRSG